MDARLRAPTPRPHRRSRLAVPVLSALCLLPLGSLACSGSGGGPPSASPPGHDADELVRIHQAMTVPGLEDRRFQPDAYWRAIAPFTGEAWRVREAGRSAEDRPIRWLSAGDGPTAVLLWSQMHGDESTASMALADVVRFVHDWPDHPLVRTILDGTTLHLVPVLNPDGAARFQRRNAQGIDVNRDARRLETPEGRTLKAVRDAVVPDFGFNLHDQDPSVRVGDSDRQVAIALLAPAFNEARDVDPKRRRAMRVASLLVEAVEPLVGDRVAKYDDTFNPRAFGDLMGAWGASTVLIESGGWPDDPQKQHLRRTNFVALVSALEAIATGRYAEWSPRRYEDLPYNGRRVADLLIRGGSVAVPGLPVLRSDVLVRYDRPLLGEGGTIAELGDLEGTEAQDTLDVSGLYLVPLPEALDATGALGPGAPAHFTVAEDPEGERVRFRFRGGR